MHIFLELRLGKERENIYQCGMVFIPLFVFLKMQ